MDENPWEPVLAAQDRADRGPHRPWALAIVVIAVTVALLATALVVVSIPQSVPHTSTPTANATLIANGSAVIAELPSTYLGVNVGAVLPLTSASSKFLNATPTTVVVWPGGSTSDQLNLSTGLITYDSGTTEVAAVNESAFVAWCQARGCDAILQVPGEIDDPAMAAYFVRYTESTLHFFPAYWQIGDEPALWKHFGLPWSAWNATQATNATPMQYADLVHTYIVAMRAVDPTIHVIGLPGVGTGAYGETSWIAATVAVNGPNLSAIAIHIYPAGTPPGGPATLSQFYAALSSTRTVGFRVPADRAAIAAACPTCHIPLFVTELGSGIQGGSFDPYIGGFAQVPFLASQLVESMSLNVTTTDVFQFQSPRVGAWEDANGTIHPLYTLYTTILPQVQPNVVASTVTGSANDFYALTSRNPNGTVWTVLGVNTNLTTNVALNLSAVNLPTVGSVESWAWSSQVGTPIATAWSHLDPTWTIGPESLLLLRITANSPTVVIADRGDAMPLALGPTPFAGSLIAAGRPAA